MSNKQRKIIIAGTSQFSLVMLDIIQKEQQGDVIAFTLNEEYINGNEISDMPVVAFEKLEDYFNMDEVEILLSFGYSNLNALRESFFYDCLEKNYRIASFVSKNALVYSDEIGDGNLILPNTYVGPFCKIGKCNIIWNGVNVSHHSIIGDFNCIAPGAMLAGNVEVGNNCFLGVGCSCKNGVKIASKTFIGAASYVSKNTMQNVAYTGNPAQPIKGGTALDVINMV